jgi:Domain of unknown function (DUF4338)
MATDPVIRAQGRVLAWAEFIALQKLIDEHPGWSRNRIGAELCQSWGWRTWNGQLKTFAARSLLLTLEQRYELRLPPLREQCRRQPWGLKQEVPLKGRPVAPIRCSLEQLQPLQWRVCSYQSDQRPRALGLLRQYHYLGCNRPVGTHLLYLVEDRQGRALAVQLVGASVWQCAARDAYIGWEPDQRAAHLPHIANHSRFLILPWVGVPHLASHLLKQLTRRLSEDWLGYHGRRLWLVESFVETGRFEGAAYQAAGWLEVGQTTGRTRQEKQHCAQAPRKSVWVYPLGSEFGRPLGQGGAR